MKLDRLILATISVAVLAAVLAVAPKPAAAQNKAAAEALFNDARALLKAGDYAAACPKFEASQRMDPALGTLLNLATCYEKLGRVASAWARFAEAADLAKRAGESKRGAYARKQQKALEPRLPHVRIVVSEPVDGLVVQRDGETVDSAAFDTPLPVDPGKVVVSAHAPGYKEVSLEVTASEGKETRAEIPALEKLPEPATPPATDVTAPEGSATTPENPAPSPRDRGATRPGHTQRIIGLSVGVGGVVALGAGVAFGLSARSKWNQAFDQGDCDEQTNVCNPDGQALTNSARSRANIATIVSIAGGAALVAGTVVYLIAPHGHSGDKLTVLPVAGRSSWGVVMEGQF